MVRARRPRQVMRDDLGRFKGEIRWFGRYPRDQDPIG